MEGERLRRLELRDVRHSNKQDGIVKEGGKKMSVTQKGSAAIKTAGRRPIFQDGEVQSNTIKSAPGAFAGQRWCQKTFLNHCDFNKTVFLPMKTERDIKNPFRDHTSAISGGDQGSRLIQHRIDSMPFRWHHSIFTRVPLIKDPVKKSNLTGYQS